MIFSGVFLINIRRTDTNTIMSALTSITFGEQDSHLARKFFNEFFATSEKPIMEWVCPDFMVTKLRSPEVCKKLDDLAFDEFFKFIKNILTNIVLLYHGSVPARVMKYVEGILNPILNKGCLQGYPTQFMEVKNTLYLMKKKKTFVEKVKILLGGYPALYREEIERMFADTIPSMTHEEIMSLLVETLIPKLTEAFDHLMKGNVDFQINSKLLPIQPGK